MRIGFLGVGNMGQPMAGKLLDAGHDLWIYDAREGVRFSSAKRVRRPHRRSWWTHATRSSSPSRHLRFFSVRFPDPTACSADQRGNRALCH